MAQHITVADERYVFRPETRNRLLTILVAGVVLLAIGLFTGRGEKAAEGDHGGGHSAVKSEQLVADAQPNTSAEAESHEEGAEHGETPYILKRLYTSLWMNNVFFAGLGIIGLFFVAIQYAAQAGWSAGILRIPMAMGSWIGISGILMIILWFVVGHTVFHWTHESLYAENTATFDPLISKKAPFFFWPGEAGGFPIFFLFRMVVFFGLWYVFFITIKRRMLDEDLDPNVEFWYRNRVTSAWFLIVFAISSSVAAWDWIMSIDTHWFSTMFGWYMFASWWVTGLAVITLIVVNLIDAGYLRIVNANHLHDLGKFIFAFSIFWCYIWFSQYLLIWYANIPEETVYFIERRFTSPYSWIFYANLVLNFGLPFLLFMTRDAKRQISTLKLVCPIVVVGHWFDFYNMVTPGVMKTEGAVGLLEIGLAMIFLAAFLLVVLSSLAKMPLIGKNHPMLQESLHHHI